MIEGNVSPSVSTNAQRAKRTSSTPTAVALSALTASIFLLSVEDAQHWSIVPLACCGALVLPRAIDWARGRVPLFDPAAILALLGIHFFFISPLLHITWDYWLFKTFWRLTIPPPNDWRLWVGLLAAMNAIGLVLYELVRGHIATRSRGHHVAWRLDSTRFWTLVFPALAITGAAQALAYASFGGIGGYVEAYESRSFGGMGLLFMVSESFPIIAMMGFAVLAREKAFARTWTVLLLAVLGFFLAKMLFGGLRGSRSNTIWGLFWAVGIIHLWVRRIPRRLIVFGAPFLLSFIYLYGFYKVAGTDGLEALEDADVREELSEQKGLGAERTLLGDLGRTDIQSFVLYSMSRRDSDYELALGRTYVGAAALVIPRAIWPDRPLGKVSEATEITYGKGTYIPNVVQSSRVHGIAGEALLNFGPVGVPLSFIVLGWVVGAVQRLQRSMSPADARWLLFPLLVNLCFVLLVGDSDNTVFFLLKNGLVPFVLIALSCRREPRRASHEGRDLSPVQRGGLRTRETPG